METTLQIITGEYTVICDFVVEFTDKRKRHTFDASISLKASLVVQPATGYPRIYFTTLQLYTQHPDFVLGCTKYFASTLVISEISRIYSLNQHYSLLLLLLFEIICIQKTEATFFNEIFLLFVDGSDEISQKWEMQSGIRALQKRS